MSMTDEQAVELPPLIRYRYLWWAAAAIAAMWAVILSGDEWLLNWLHVITGVLWTGIDLFLAFVLGPTLRKLDFNTRRAVAIALLPRTLILMPALATISPTTGWYLAVAAGYPELAAPEIWWFWGALGITAFMGVQGVFYILPINVIACLELRKHSPDEQRIGRLMRHYIWSVGFQGVLQVSIIVVMSRFATGL